MAKILDGVSRTFRRVFADTQINKKNQSSESINLAASMAASTREGANRFDLNIPIVSAAMQSVTDSNLAIALAREGGLGFIYCSQDVKSQAAMVAQVKSHKAGFVSSDTNTLVGESLEDVVALMKKTGHSTVPVTSDGTATGKLLGIITDQDFWEHEDNLKAPVERYMTKNRQCHFWGRRA